MGAAKNQGFPWKELAFHDRVSKVTQPVSLCPQPGSQPANCVVRKIFKFYWDLGAAKNQGFPWKELAFHDRVSKVTQPVSLCPQPGSQPANCVVRKIFKFYRNNNNQGSPGKEIKLFLTG